MRALAVPSGGDGRGGLALERGHRVDVLATFDTGVPEPVAVATTEADDGQAPTFPVAAGALVLDVGTESVTIAVRPREAPRVAFALARGTVTLALTGEPGEAGGR
jgi:Flp pilus assembly protein CpaB